MNREPWASDSDAPRWMLLLAEAFAVLGLVVTLSGVAWSLMGLDVVPSRP